MIKIQRIGVDLMKEYKKYTFSRLRKFLKDVFSEPKYKKVIKYLSCNGELCDRKIERLLLGDITELIAAIREIGEIKDEENNEGFHKLYNSFINSNLGKEWGELIGVSVCPYCNRSYIYTLKKHGVRPQYDHFFPKSKYPYLAISMYNLIPCCAICNIAKSDFDTYDHTTGIGKFIYPFEDSYGTDIYFRTTFSGDFRMWLGLSDNFEITIEYSDKTDNTLRCKQKTAADTLHIKELYNKHKDYVRDIIRRAYIYDDNYFHNLAMSFPRLFQSANEAESFVYMNYLQSEDWGKRVLAKLTFDIKNEYSC